jgi:hypothetical protein
MDNNFTELLHTWLATDAEERDYSVGALYLLKLTGNAIMYRNVVANLDAHREFIEYQLQKYYDFRVQELTHEQVEEMAAQVETIVATELSLSTESAGVSRGRNGFRKDKSGEKLPESEENLLELRTDGTDAFDTLYIGCEKFPQHDTFSLSSSGVI